MHACMDIHTYIYSHPGAAGPHDSSLGGEDPPLRRGRGPRGRLDGEVLEIDDGDPLKITDVNVEKTKENGDIIVNVYSDL